MTHWDFESGLISWPKLNHCANVDHFPDLIDLGIGYGDTAVSPIEMALEPANPAQTVFKTVDFNISARIHSCLLRSLPINQVGIRKMQRQVKSALALLSIDIYSPSGVLWSPCRVFAPTGFRPIAIL